MRQRTLSLIGCLMLAGLVSFPSDARIILHASRPPKAQSIQMEKHLSDDNEALDKALEIHNLLNEMPGLRDIAQNAKDMEQQGEILKEMQKNITSCNVKKLGKVFKDPQKVWSKMTETYERKRQESQKELEDKKQDSLTISLQQRRQNELMGWNINREIVMDVYTNPEKWGDVNKGESFPLWKDQISLFEKEWNQFYEQLNATYGVPLKGRPAVDEETKHNYTKYDTVLAAHKAYISQISEGHRPSNKKIADGKPPRAPKALPKWQDIVRIDSITGKPIPELPEPWKKMSENKFKNYTAGGEMAQVFSGKSMTPIVEDSSNGKSDLEAEYEMTLAIDAMNKGVMSSFDTQQKMVQSFIDKLAQFKIDVSDFDISNRAKYVYVQNQLKELKKKAIEEAREYTEKLETQDKNDPSYAARREQLKAQKRARLSAEAQTATMGISDTLQIAQMSPVTQQRLVLSALEKDESASVYLTQTNAINVDQLMREQKSTNKIISESHKQMNSVIEKQREIMPQMAECRF